MQHFIHRSNSLKYIIVLVYFSIFGILSTISQFNPSDEIIYPINSINNPGILFPFGGDIPTSRVHHTITATTDYLIVYGGYSTDGSLLGDVNLFYITSQQWSGPITRKQCCNEDGESIETIGIDDVNIDYPYIKMGFQGDYPLPRAEHGACVISDEMYIFGGISESFGYLNDLYKYNPKEALWIIQESSQSYSYPVRRAGHSMICDDTNSMIYIFGGRTKVGTMNPQFDSKDSTTHDNVGLNDIWQYDVIKNSWSILTTVSNNNVYNSPARRQHASVILINGNLYLFGGIDPSSGMLFNDVWIYYIGSKSWELLYDSRINNNYQYAPPPLYNAHIIIAPESLDPYTSINTTATYDHTTTTKSKEQTTIENKGFLIYGGIGGGGHCGNLKQCDGIETTLGQVYRFVLTENKWQSPRSSTGSKLHIDKKYISDISWEYARISSSFDDVSSSSVSNLERTGNLWNTQGKMIKSFTYEKTIFIPSRNIMYEFGGLITNQDKLTSYQQFNMITSEDVLNQTNINPKIIKTNTIQPDEYVIDNKVQQSSTTSDKVTPIFLTQASGSLSTPFWDRNTGEVLKERVDLPTTSIWDYTQAFTNNIPYDSSNSNKNIKFLRAFRTYTISPNDIVLIKEDSL